MIERVLFWSLITTTVLAPLPLGSNRPWSWSLLALIFGGLSVAWAIASVVKRAPAPFGLRLTWPVLLPFALAVVWVTLQTASWLPDAWHHPMWMVAATALGRELDGSISLDPFASWTIVMRLLTYGTAFWLSLQLGRERRRARQMLIALIGAAGAYALYGLGVQLSGSRTIIWMQKWAYEEVLTSTFVNRNSYATYAGLGLVCAAALLVDTLARASEWPTTLKRQRLGQVIAVLSGPGSLILLSIALLVTALALTASRGGFAASAAGLSVFFLASTRIRPSLARFGRKVALAVVLIAVAAILFVSGDPLSERFLGTEMPRVHRAEVFGTTIQAIDAAPMLGTGAGTFEHVFRYLQTPSVQGNWHRAHNTYLENALELGIPGAAILALSTVIAATTCMVGIFRRRRDRVYPMIALSASVLVGVHALVDFSLQIPAISLTYAFLLGLGYAQAWRHSDVFRDDERAFKARARTPRERRASAAAPLGKPARG